MRQSTQEFAIARPLVTWDGATPARSERRLVRAAQRGSEQAIEDLVRLHWPAAHQAAFLITRDAAAAEDIAQESILGAIDSLHRFDRRRRFRPWLHRIVANRSIDWVRARDRRREVELDGAAAVSLRDDSAAAALEILATLDPRTRAIVVLRCLLDYRPREIAAMVDLSSGAVRTRLHRGLAELRRAIEGDEG
ncbi:MAG: RNA polymerase sigma factor, partial [Solirubrobacterales bacterium]